MNLFNFSDLIKHFSHKIHTFFIKIGIEKPIVHDHLVIDEEIPIDVALSEYKETAPVISATVIQQKIESPVVVIDYATITESESGDTYVALESFEVNSFIFDTAVEVLNANESTPLFRNSHELMGHLETYGSPQKGYSKASYLVPDEIKLWDNFTSNHSIQFPNESLINNAFWRGTYSVDHLRWIVGEDRFNTLFTKKCIFGTDYYVSKTHSTDKDGGTVIGSMIEIQLGLAKNSVKKSFSIKIAINKDSIALLDF